MKGSEKTLAKNYIYDLLRILVIFLEGVDICLEFAMFVVKDLW